MKSDLPKIVVILGPTGSGKTDLGIAIAKKYNGEIISADSRQIYKKMDIGTAKPKGEWKDDSYTVEGVPHYLMDIFSPDEEFSLADFKEQAIKRIYDIQKRGKLPIIVGGTGLYIWAIVDNLEIPKTPPNKELRTELEKKSLEELVDLLKKYDPDSAELVDIKNPRRVLRALEVVLSSGKSFFEQRQKFDPLFDVLQIGINLDKEQLQERINKRVDDQIREGLVNEVQYLVNENYGWQLPSMSGIGYKQIGCYLRGEIGLEEAISLIKTATRQYAKRQMTWFKRDKRIRWLEKTDLEEANKLLDDFLIN